MLLILIWVSPHLQTPTQATVHSSHQKTARIIEKHLPAPTPQDRAKSDQDGHPARVKTKGR